MDTSTALLIGLLALVILAAVALLLQRRRSQALRKHYGAEYIAAVDETGSRREAEAALRRREKRVESFDIRPLAAAEAERFHAEWRRVQAEFVDDPGQAIEAADRLLGEVMTARGYPVSDFEQRASDLSVEHPKLVSDYRIAHEVARQHAQGRAGTEDLRRAMIHYRDLFDDLTAGTGAAPAAAEPRTFAPEEDLDHERAARVRNEERTADDRAARERRRPSAPGRGAPRL